MDHRTILLNMRPQGEASLRFATELFASLSDAQHNWKPDRKKWSVAQCLEHINITNRHWNKQLKGRMPGMVKGSNQGEQKTTLYGRMIHAIVLNPKMKTKTGKSSIPPDELVGARVMEDFHRLQQEWMDLATALAEIDLNANKVRPPALGFVKWRLGEAMAINTAHTTRHLKQAERVMQMPGFPRS